MTKKKHYDNIRSDNTLELFYFIIPILYEVLSVLGVVPVLSMSRYL